MRAVKKKEQMRNEKFTTVKHHFRPKGNRKNAGWLPIKRQKEPSFREKRRLF